MALTDTSPSAAVRARLKHPVIDSDGHFIESIPTFLDYLNSVAGTEVASRFESAWGSSTSPRSHGTTSARRSAVTCAQPARRGLLCRPRTHWTVQPPCFLSYYLSGSTRWGSISR